MKALSTRSFHALGTTAVIVSTRADALEETRSLLLRKLRALDLACSRFREDSELVGLNRAGGARVVVGPVLLEAVRVALHVAWTTGGLVDPTLGRTLRLAGYDRTFTRVQNRDGELVRPSFEPGGRWDEIALDARRSTIRLPRGVELDLGATAKALAADQVAFAASQATGGGVLIGLGGDIAVAGEPPDEGWAIGIAHDHRAPLGAEAPTVGIAAGGLASSGTTVRRWRTAAGAMHHVVDPRTGRPVSGPWTLVSAAAASCVEANAASTAAIVLGAAAPAWLEQRKLAARLARADGSVVLTRAWPEGPADAA